jgi:hypothetical protein
MCMRTVLPPSLSHWGTHAVLYLALGHTRYDPSLSRVQCESLTLGRVRCTLSHIGVRALCSLLHAVRQTGGGMRAQQQQEEA